MGKNQELIRIGVVGTGIVGVSHIQSISLNSSCVLAAVCDLNVGKAKEAVAQSEVRVYADYKEMAEKTKLDAVILNLPHYLHCEVACWFLEKGIHLLVEKPMAMNRMECEKMIQTAKKCGVKLAVGHVQRYFSAYGMIRQMILEETFGKLCMISEVRNKDYFTNRPSWFLDKKYSGGGMLMNYGAHTLDKVFYTTGLRIDAISAKLNNFLTEDNVEASAQILLTLTGGVSLNITYCGCKVPSVYETVFYFTNGAVKTEGGNSIWITENGRYIEKQLIEVNCIEAQLTEFVKFLRGEPSNICTAEFGMDVMDSIDRIYESSKWNGRFENATKNIRCN